MSGPAAASDATSHANQKEFSLSATPHTALLALALLLTALVYAATLRFNFVYDDWPQIVNNGGVHSWRFLPGYFTQHVWSNLYPGAPGNYYRPLFMVWLLVNFSVFGATPLGWHLMTVLAHLGVTAMVYWLTWRLIGDAGVVGDDPVANRDAVRAGVTAAIAALLFGVHPAHIESVAWVSGVTEPLLALLLIPAFVFYMNARRFVERRNMWMAASLIFYAMALLSKETAIVLPAFVFVYEWLADGRAIESPSHRWLRVTVTTLPYVVVSLIYVWVRHAVLSGLMFPEAALSLKDMLLTWPSLAWLYLQHLILPVGLGVFYDTPYIFHPTLRNFGLPLLGCFAAAGLLIAASRKSKLAAIASLWLVLPLLPPLAAIGLFSHVDLAHDRYLYVPSIGFVILVAMLLRPIPSYTTRAELLEVNPDPGKAGGRGLRKPPLGFAGQIVPALILAAVLAALTVMQSIPWANNLLLYYRGVQTAPHSALARSHLGSEMMARGDIFDALRLYREARDLSPDDWATSFVLGFAYFQAGHYAEAEQPLRDAIKITPRNGNQYLYLGLTLMNLGRLDEAEASVRQGIAASPPSIPGFHYGLGMVLQREGKLAAARDEFRIELRLDPSSGARANLAEVEKQLAGQGR